jgi:hypothetical protein
MECQNVLAGAILLIAMGTSMMQSQTPVNLALDSSKPIVYIEFDHAGPREPIEDGEPAQGLWLRLVNNSVVAIEVKTTDTTTQPKLILVPDEITWIVTRIRPAGKPPGKCP